MAGKFPRAYVNEVQKDPIMEYVPFEETGIGSRPSGLPKGGKNSKLGLDHTGKAAERGK